MITPIVALAILVMLVQAMRTKNYALALLAITGLCGIATFFIGIWAINQNRGWVGFVLLALGAAQCFAVSLVRKA